MSSSAAMDDASDIEQAKRARANEELNERRDLDDLDFILNDSRGRRFVWKLLESAKVFGSVYAPDQTIYYNAGRQDFGHKLFSKVTNYKEGQAYLAMMREANIEREELILSTEEKRKDG